MSSRMRFLGRRFAGAVSVVLAACTSTGTYELEFMTAPTVCSSGVIDPFEDSGIQERPTVGVLYATDREPADKDDKNTPFYKNERGRQLRFGEAFLELNDGGDRDWGESKRISFLEERDDDYAMRVEKVTEFGIYDKSQSTLFGEPRDTAPGQRFAQVINSRLAKSRGKDIYIYVHGYKAEFTFPVLVSAQLWYFLGLRGLFVAYSWPATPNPMAYFKDLETAGHTARHLRLLLEFLATKTQVRRIHVIGYSAGTRVVADTIGQIALLQKGRSATEAVAQTKIGQVILVGADVDPGRMNGYVEDGALNVVDRLTIYQSDTDAALGFSAWLLSRRRMGQTVPTESIDEKATAAIRRRDRLSLINITEAKGATKGNGHGYFRKSPWVSSDILINLMYGRPPNERGLVRDPDSAFWRFPTNYVERLRKKFDKPVAR